jgi:hypothetical protein
MKAPIVEEEALSSHVPLALGQARLMPAHQSRALSVQQGNTHLRRVPPRARHAAPVQQEPIVNPLRESLLLAPLTASHLFWVQPVRLLVCLVR